MDRSDHTDADYRQPHAPSDTPPAIEASADAAMDDCGSHAPGSQPAHFHRGRGEEAGFDEGIEGHVASDGGAETEPGKQPDEIVPDKGDNYEPDRAPDEVAPDQGDFDQPDSSPIEAPPQPDTAPLETPPPD